MTREEILKGLGDVIDDASADEVDWSSVTEETSLESFGFDSLSVLDLIFDLEQEMGVKVTVPQVLEMKKVGCLVSFLETRVA